MNTYQAIVKRGSFFWTGYKWSPEASDAVTFNSFHKARACWEFVTGKDVRGPAGVTNVVEYYGTEDESVAL